MWPKNSLYFAKIFFLKKALNIPAIIRFTISVAILLLLFMTAYRLFFYFHYRPAGKPLSGNTMLTGLRFDARVVAILSILMVILGSIKIISPFKSLASKKVWAIILSIIFLVFFFFYISDFYHYDYLQQRLNVQVLGYGQDAAISLGMVWQTYPVVKVLLLCAGLLLFFYWFVKKQIGAFGNYYQKGIKSKWYVYAVSYLLLALIVFGKVGQYPLRWSDAFALGDDFKANAALNPFQSFASSLKFKNAAVKPEELRTAFPLVASSLHLPVGDTSAINFKRQVTFIDSFTTKPNVVIVICESFSAPKSSMFNNGLNPTLFFDSLCKRGMFFDRCFTPANGTARGVWAVLTGVPDVEYPATASRNPMVVNQHTIINDFKGYNKYYFLGGSTTWANIRGVLNNNIEGLQIYEQDNFDAKRVDVWGISDKNLFLAANDVFKKQGKPFISIIQTADNHRPYTIPEEDRQVFKKIEFPKDSLDKYGFDGNDQFNAFRYMDFCFKTFIDAAAKEKYFANTVFVFVGDHGIGGNGGKMLPKSFTEEGFVAEHVPFLFYGEKFVAPKRIHAVVSQLDLLPTVAAIVRQPYTNTTLGRNLTDSINLKNSFAFIADPNFRTKAVVNNEFYFSENLNTGKKAFVSVTNDLPVQKNAYTDSARQSMEKLTNAWHTISRHLLLNNKK